MIFIILTISSPIALFFYFFNRMKRITMFKRNIKHCTKAEVTIIAPISVKKILCTAAVDDFYDLLSYLSCLIT